MTIPDGVTSIGYQSFYGCTGLTSINIPSSITSIAEKAFQSAINIARVDITDLDKWCRIQFYADTMSNPTYYAKGLWLNGQ